MTSRYATTFGIATIMLATALTAGCARQISPDVHAGRSAGQTIATELATIQQVRLIEIQEQDTLEGNRTGQILGGLAGGIAGARFGDGIGRALASAGGAILGAFVGALAEQEIKRQPALEYVVRTDQGELLTIVQGTVPRMVAGQRVYLQDARYGRGRIIPAG